MSCHRCLRRPPEDAEPAPATSADGSREAHPPTALETLRQTVPTRSIQSPHVPSEESADSPSRAAWIIS